jgi:NTE family protein
MSLPLLYQPGRSVRDDPYIDGGILDSYPIKLFDRKKYMTNERIRAHGTETVYYRTLNKKLESAKMSISPYIFNKETLSFRLDTPFEAQASFRDQSEPRPAKMDDFYDFTVSLINVMIEAQRNRHLHADDWQRTIFINTLGVRAFDFGIADALKNELVQSGRHGTSNYFNWYDNPKSRPVNRV